ncbi:Pex19 protein family-domain-containing protein [Biscogniauxia sp. FL1348]|nr:Pex19 protein family-domain-containing protein [Biscogniauxia sp. FL1348]
MDTKQAGSAGNGSKPGAEDPPKDSAAEPIAPPPPTVEDVSDPDEDDLDDLDDMLGEFSGVAIDTKKPTTTAGPDRPSAIASEPATAAQDDLSEEEFQKQLQAGMEELMNDLEKSPDMQAQFENIFKGLGAAAAGSGDDAAASTSKPADKMASDLSQDANFQETIRRTMARMQESGEQATAAAAAGSSEDDFLAEMMKAMKDMPSGDGEEEFSKMLMGMMEQLTNKEILYEPMKELNEKFPGWMTKNKDTLSKEDLKRYQEQQVLVAEMVAKFEEPTYADSNAADREYIVDRMQKMQAAGAPPHDLVGDMPSAKEVLDGPDDSCPTQ